MGKPTAKDLETIAKLMDLNGGAWAPIDHALVLSKKWGKRATLLSRLEDEKN